ncbi:hypothetical protein PFISCL1PPCAC_4081, partial [Pristionchus fissidentatus]
RTCSFIPKELKDAVEAEMQTSPSFSIFVKTLIGEHYELTLDRGARTAIEILKELIHQQGGFAPDLQRLIFAGKQLEDERTCGEYNIKSEATIHQVQRMRGC